ncbi:MAG: sigma-54-dependent Fis family transcriptional regulator [Desulfarculus sp.]|nr:sigma-54-dependent Fis family transcriptional regulator [Desulfarculus sp.]
MPFKPRILIVEDDAVARRNLQHILEKGGEYLIEPAGGGAEALQKLARGSYHLVMTDLRMEKVDGMAVLAEVRSRHPDTEVIMLTAYASVDSAIEAMKLGAFHYIAKPYKIDEVRAQVAHALEKSRLKEELHQLRSELKAREGLGLVLGKNAKILKLVRTLGQIAPTDCNVLISGETGTGKEVFARAVHYASPRAGGRFLAFNCGAFTEELLASELFGHERGAFTGAVATKRGLFEAADGGTIFLDEIGDMPTPMQVKLLRVIQEKVVLRVGGTEPVRVDVRIVAATHQDLKKLVEQGRFRSDLFYRLNVVSLNVPPLRERKDDIPLLATYFLQKFAAQQNKNIRGISQEMMRALGGHHFPGNVRELENIIERAVALSTGEVLDVKDLPDELKETSLAGGVPEGGLPSLEEKERQYILWVLSQTRGNRTKAAEILGVDRVSLWRKLKRYGMEQ